MATRKTTANVEEVKTAAAEEPEVKAKPAKEPEKKSAWDEEVEMLIPRKPAGDDQQYYVCVNDRRYMIPANGKTQKLPRPIAEALKEGLEDEAKAEEYAEHIPNKQA